jgi:hypothetical protein
MASSGIAAWLPLPLAFSALSMLVFADPLRIGGPWLIAAHRCLAAVCVAAQAALLIARVGWPAAWFRLEVASLALLLLSYAASAVRLALLPLTAIAPWLFRLDFAAWTVEAFATTHFIAHRLLLAMGIPGPAAPLLVVALVLVVGYPMMALLPGVLSDPSVLRDARVQEAARLSLDVYEAKPGASGVLLTAGGDVHARFTRSKLGDALYVLFPGTDDKRDLKVDLAMGVSKLRAPYATADATADAGVHAGIHAEYIRNHPALLKRLRADLKSDAKLPVVFAGHSLGGAYAQLAGLYCASAVEAGARVITFGAPAFGDYRFSEVYRATVGGGSVRVYNPFDPVVNTSTSQFVHADIGHPVAGLGASGFPSPSAHKMAGYVLATGSGSRLPMAIAATGVVLLGAAIVLAFVGIGTIGSAAHRWRLQRYR